MYIDVTFKYSNIDYIHFLFQTVISENTLNEIIIEIAALLQKQHHTNLLSGNVFIKSITFV